MDKEVDRTYLKRRRIVSILSLVSLVAFMVVGTALIGPPLVRFLDDPDSFRAWADSGPWGRPALVGIMVVQIIISLIPGGVVEIAAGTCYGGFEGGLICLVGAAIGSSIVFLMVKRFGVPLVEAFISREKLHSLSFMRDADRLQTLLFILYLIPGTPKDVFNYFVGLTPLKLRQFLLFSVLARAPAIFATTYCGDALIEGEYLKAAVVFGVTMLFSVGGLIFYRWFVKRGKAASDKPESP